MLMNAPHSASSETTNSMSGWLDLLQLADSALPVGSQSHSFGLETLIADGVLNTATLAPLLSDYLDEMGVMEAIFWRGAYAIGANWQETNGSQWLVLNRRLSALRLARESRAASAALGRRFLALAADVQPRGRLHAPSWVANTSFYQLVMD
jgi:urease accessory protein